MFRWLRSVGKRLRSPRFDIFYRSLLTETYLYFKNEMPGLIYMRKKVREQDDGS